MPLWAMGGRSRSCKQHLQSVENKQESELHLQLGITDRTCSHILPEDFYSMNSKDSDAEDLIQTLKILLPLYIFFIS